MIEEHILSRFSPDEKSSILILESMGFITYNNDAKGV